MTVQEADLCINCLWQHDTTLRGFPLKEATTVVMQQKGRWHYLFVHMRLNLKPESRVLDMLGGLTGINFQFTLNVNLLVLRCLNAGNFDGPLKVVGGSYRKSYSIFNFF